LKLSFGHLLHLEKDVVFNRLAVLCGYFQSEKVTPASIVTGLIRWQ
jgi:hypothetical protein